MLLEGARKGAGAALSEQDPAQGAGAGLSSKDPYARTAQEDFWHHTPTHHHHKNCK